MESESGNFGTLRKKLRGKQEKESKKRAPKTLYSPEKWHYNKEESVLATKRTPL